MSFTFRPYQIEAAKTLSDILLRKRFALDGSDTGIGKTFTAIATALEFSSPPVAVICRAKAQTKWKEALTLFNIVPIFIMSWEKARGKNEFFLPIKNKRGRTTTFSLRLAEPTIVVIDEIHAGGAVKSQNAELVIATRRCPDAYLLGLSASVADTPLKMRAIGFCCGLHSLGDTYFNWCRKNGCGKSPFGGMYFRKRDRDRVLGSIHKLLFGHEDSWGIRLHKKDLMQAGQFPESEVFVELWDISINYPAWLHPFIDIVTEKEMSDEDKHEGEVPAIVAATRERQRSELMKVPALIEEIEDRLEEGEYVVVFLQYVDTIKAVLSRIKCEAALITGGWSGKKSQVEMEKFQSGKVQLCICQTDAGSESIDLHDIDGSRPRHVIIFPTYKSNTLIQVIGRTVRSGGKSPVVQRLVYSSGGIEEKIAKAVEGKLENLSMLMDGDLTGGNLL